MRYEMEELLPVVAQLSRRFTTTESTSISYEKAQQFMGAVLFCIDEFEQLQENMPAKQKGIPAKEAYQLGFEAVMQKARKTQEMYNELMSFFYDYGNDILKDTVEKAVYGFFQYYDPVFAPQHTRITMDYPVLNVDQKLQGIDAIAAYVKAIYTEQIFLQKLPREYICPLLYRFDFEYKEQFFNIGSVVMRHLLGNMMMEKRMGTAAIDTDYQNLFILLKEKDEIQLQNTLYNCFQLLIQKEYDENHDIANYFEKEITEFTIRLKQVEEVKYLENVVIL